MELEYEVESGNFKPFNKDYLSSVNNVIHNLREVNRESKNKINLDKLEIEYNQLVDIEGICLAISSIIFVYLYLSLVIMFKSTYLLYVLPLFGMVFYYDSDFFNVFL